MRNVWTKILPNERAQASNAVGCLSTIAKANYSGNGRAAGTASSRLEHLGWLAQFDPVGAGNDWAHPECATACSMQRSDASRPWRWWSFIHVLDCEPSFEAVDPLLKDPKRLLNQTVGLTECPVVALAVIGQIGEVGSFEPWLQCLRGWQLLEKAVFPWLQTAALKNPAVVALLAITWFDVEHFLFWACDAKDVVRVAVVAVEVRLLVWSPRCVSHPWHLQAVPASGCSHGEDQKLLQQPVAPLFRQFEDLALWCPKLYGRGWRNKIIWKILNSFSEKNDTLE